MNETHDYQLVSTQVGGLPIVNRVIDRLGLPGLLSAALPTGDARVKLQAASAVRLVVTNLVLGREPLYALGEWAALFDPALLALSATEVGAVNDDRIGRALEELFDADRASMQTAVALRAIKEFHVDTTQLHNDSTSVTLHGNYKGATGTTRGEPTPVITFGHSKDHRPDLKQLVWILTVTADGSLPLAYRLADGNTSDDPTHIPTWDALVALLGRSDFLYVADSKLCSRAAMAHISTGGGRFVTVSPRSRTEVNTFHDWIQTNTPTWTEATRRPGDRIGEPDHVYSTTPAPELAAEGYRITWVHSTSKAARDAATREANIDAAHIAIDVLHKKLARPYNRLKTRTAVQAAATAAINRAHAEGWVTATITETVTTTQKQLTRGRPGPATRYRQIHTPHHTVHAETSFDQVAHDAAYDGCFPLISNDHNLTGAELLAAYRYQPNLERRHHLLKSVQHAAPVLLKNPARIEALFFCQFLALLISALIEREVRTAMADTKTATLAIYPEFRGSAAPSTERILEIFATTTRHHLYVQGNLIRTFPPELTTQHRQVLDLFGLAPTAYTEQPKMPT